MTTDTDRKKAEQEYANTAFDYVSAPIGSGDWRLFWQGWQAARASIPQAAAPTESSHQRWECMGQCPECRGGAQ